MKAFPVEGVGLGLRRSFLFSPELLSEDNPIDFLEVAPENWIGIGGRRRRMLTELVERYPFVCHGLSLSLGGPEPFNLDYLSSIKTFLKDFKIRCYSEHLSYCSDHGQLYDLLPIPFTAEAVTYVANRIRFVQDFLGQRIAIENVSYYASLAQASSPDSSTLSARGSMLGCSSQKLTEIEFISAVLAESDCDLLLDVNNVYVNSLNHDYDPEAFLKQLPVERVAYAHVAGHYSESPDLLVDTHGADVSEQVWRLLAQAYNRFGCMPTLLERDFNIPAMDELFTELREIHRLQSSASCRSVDTESKPSKANAYSSLLETPSNAFQSIQRQFAAHLRHPEKNLAPLGIEERRIEIYRDLLFNNVETFIANTFPVLKSIYPSDEWKNLVRDFFHQHTCQTPYFIKIGEEFLSYIRIRQELAQDPPFLQELAYYEYLELELSISEPPDLFGVLCSGEQVKHDLLSGFPVVSTQLRVLNCQYPVHLIGAEHSVKEACGEETPIKKIFLVLYLDATEKVRFLEVNSVYARLLQLLMNNVVSQIMTGQAALEQIAQELQNSRQESVNVQTVLAFGASLLAELHEKGLILGIRIN